MNRHLLHESTIGEEGIVIDQALSRALTGKRVLIAYGLIGERLAAMRRIGVEDRKSVV